jgi:hypothetical protein
MPYFSLHYGGTYSVNPLGIRRDSEAPSRGRMDKRKTKSAGLASSRRTRLGRDAAFGAAMVAVALGLAAWVTDFDLAGSIPLPRRSAARPRLTSASVRARCAVRWRSIISGVRRHARISMPNSGISKASWVDHHAKRSRTFSPRRPPRWPSLQSRCQEPARSWPIFSQGGAIRRRRRRITAPCSRSSPIWCRCASRWRR